MEALAFSFAREMQAERDGGDPDGLRDYQRTCVTAVRRELESVRATLAVLATGMGKTQIGGTVVKHWPGRVLWLAHRDELIRQAAERIQLMAGEQPSIDMAAEYSWGSRIVVGSVQTLQRKRLERHPPDRFSLIVIDEAHHAPSRSYRNILEHFAGAKVFGITATADRLDGVAQANVFDSIAFRKDIDEGIAEGYLVPIVPEKVDVKSIDLSKIKTIGGDLSEGEVEKEMLKSIAAIARPTFEVVGDRKTLVFTPGVGSAHAVAAALNEMRPDCARVVDGTTDRDLRKQILRAHKAGEFQFLCNCLVFTEGYDDPTVRAVVNARPTKSRALYVQIAGRGLRVLPGIGELATVEERIAAIKASAKPDCLLVDITGCAGRHKLIGPVDLLGGKYLPEEQERAQRILDEDGGELVEALEQAREQLRAEKVQREADERSRELARAAAAAQVRHTSSRFDLFGRVEAMGASVVEDRSLAEASGPATPDDRQWLGANKLDDRGLTHADVLKMQRTAAQWRKMGAATWKQRRVLAKQGIDVPFDLPFRDASVAIDAIAQNGWKPLPREQVDRLMGRKEVAA
jgi:superfamily II DNA or RNA helicase